MIRLECAEAPSSVPTAVERWLPALRLPRVSETEACGIFTAVLSSLLEWIRVLASSFLVSIQSSLSVVHFLLVSFHSLLGRGSSCYSSIFDPCPRAGACRSEGRPRSPVTDFVRQITSATAVYTVPRSTTCLSLFYSSARSCQGNMSVKSIR